MDTKLLTALLSAVLFVTAFALAVNPKKNEPHFLPIAQGETVNPTEFTLTDFTDTTIGISFKRPTSWTQDTSFKDGLRFAGGDEWLNLKIISSQQTAMQYANAFAMPTGETKIGLKPFHQGKFFAGVLSSSSQGKSDVTGKATELLMDRWIFSPKLGKLVVLTITGPKKVFDWEGNRDMALSVRLK